MLPVRSSVASPAVSGSGPKVSGDGGAGAPGDGDPAVVAYRGVGEQAAQGRHDVGHGLVGGECLQPPWHGVGGDEGAGQERQYLEDRGEAGRAGRAAGGKAHRRGDPGDREQHQSREPGHRQPVQRVGGGPEADGQGEEHDEGGAQHRTQDAPEDVTGQHRGAGDGHGSEPVDDALAAVGGDGHGGGTGRIAGAHQDDPGDQVVDVSATAGADGATEPVVEQQQDHSGQDDRHDQGGRVAGGVPQDPSAKRSRSAFNEATLPSEAICRVRVSWSRGMSPSARAAASRLAASVNCTLMCPPVTRRLSSSGVPSATSVPWSRRAIRSASSSASSRYWVVRKMVTPLVARSWMTCHMVWRLRGSRPVVGSSRNRMRGSPMRLIARSRRRVMPPEYVPARLVAASARSNRSSSSVVRRWVSRRGRWCRSPIRARFSSPVSSGSTAENWPVTPIAARTASGSLATLWPATHTSPALARMSVVRMLTAVVLPAPLGPSSEKTVPGATCRSTPSSTVCSPNDLRSPVTAIAGGSEGSGTVTPLPGRRASPTRALRHGAPAIRPGPAATARRGSRPRRPALPAGPVEPVARRPAAPTPRGRAPPAP